MLYILIEVMDMPTLGEQLKSLRIKKGMTQEQLAQKLNTTKAAISRYEKDQRQPKLELLTEMAMILDASPDDLYYLFLGSTEFDDEQGVYATRMNAMAKWVETITGANGIIDSVDNNKQTASSEPATIEYSPGDTFCDGCFTVKKSVPSSDGTMKLTISVEPEGMRLKELISFLDYLKKNNLAGEGIPEMIDFMKAASKSAKGDNE